MKRPTLIPGLTRSWRDDRRLQLGSRPGRAVLITLPDPRVAQVLDLLDGTRSERLILLDAAKMGIPPDHTRAMIDYLGQAGLAMPASSLLPHRPCHTGLLPEAAALAFRGTTAPAVLLERRATARVLLAGRGRLAPPIAVALAEAGVGLVQIEEDDPVTAMEVIGGPLREADLGRPYDDAIADAIFRAVPHPAPSRVRGEAIALVVQLEHHTPTDQLASQFTQLRQPHLPVVLREGAAVVGPLVPRSGGPCLNCLDLHRRDRDPQWSGLPPPGNPEPCATATLMAGAALAAAEVLTFLDGGTPDSLGVALELSAPGRLRRRTWRPHPRCECTRTARNRRRPVPGIAATDGPFPNPIEEDLTRRCPESISSTTGSPPDI